MIENNFNIWPELDRLYSAPESTWILVRISSQSNQAEILADMIFLRDQLKSILDQVGESWLIELTAVGRKIYMKREAA